MNAVWHSPGLNADLLKIKHTTELSMQHRNLKAPKNRVKPNTLLYQQGLGCWVSFHLSPQTVQ